MKSYIIASALLFAGITGAQAADVVVQEPVAVYNWSGIYVGAQAGYAWGDAPFRNRSGNYVEGADYDPRGFLGGFYAGYSQQLSNNVVLGIEGDINFANIKRNGVDYVDFADGYVYSDNAHAKMRWNGAVRARVGYAMDRFMPYLAGGVSFGELKFDLLDPSDGSTIFSEKATMTGWNIGAGVDYAATDNLILRAEYRFSDFGSKTFHGLYGVDDGKIKLRTNDIRLGIAYKF
ncbi:outer membrane protein [Pseudaminobacter soli (ex Li et al. 2025)]|uniref:Porin family protein n=1 Tax=Pseudaminobacter soli (ex Li et al. 2025) TaxID=1295366 RepID=A0A2P7S4J9_9HYPH|nr:outer membrane protein [Mesorhizobium soli]PSJ57394.1 porin family protein [Mesorhizobium soli]